MSLSAKRLAIPLTLLVLAVYLALLPWTQQAWLRTGDEPHYLIAADSLVRDGDFDLSNNYNPSVFLDWYASPNLGRQVKARADGAQFLIHTYGLPLLIAPAYWLAGARGVAYFMALLGALLAGQVYLLSLQVTQSWRAALLGALVVALAPPLIWYVYLLYPEVAGALCVTVAARVLIDLTPHPPSLKGKGVPAAQGASAAQPVLSQQAQATHNGSPLPLRSKIPAPYAGKGGPGGLGLPSQLSLGLALAALPWLSARFLPAAFTLAVLYVLRLLWLQRDEVRPFRLSSIVLRLLKSSWLPLALFGAGLLALALFNHALYGQAAATASYTVDVSPGPVSAGMLFQFTRGVLGWLLDHQRGLLVAAPIYFVAFIGLGQWLWRRSWAALVVALPFAVALGSTALVGGFWIGIEPAARYLVYVLPPLGAALAYAWVHRRGPWLAVLATLTLAFSLWTGLQVIQDPLLAQTHDLIGERLPGLVPFLPALGKPAYLSPGGPEDLAVPVAGQSQPPALWHVPAGQAGSALQQPAIDDLPFGWYTLQFSLGASGAPAAAPVARVLLQSGDHASLVDIMLYGRDFPGPAGQPRAFSFPVFNNLYNPWAQPAGLWIFTTGQAELTLSSVALPPDPFHSLIVPALWLAGLLLLGALVGTQFKAQPAQPALPRWVPRSSLAWTVAGLVLVAGVGVWSLRPVARQFGLEDLSNFIGSRVPESAAPGGRAISTAGDEDTPGALAVSKPGAFPAGRYRWQVSLKAGDDLSAANTPLATVIIQAPRQPIPGFPAQIAAGSVPADGRFHSLAVEFDNPIQQVLVFELDATGAGPLESQGFEVSPLP